VNIPVIRGIIDRRILVNYRVDHDVLRKLLPEPFRPKLVRGVGVAGVCLIRLNHIRPTAFPAFVGISSENAAHRIAVEWEEDGQRREGVYIPRRDTSSRLNTILGGRLFPIIHHHASFDVSESDDHYRVVMNSDDGETHVAVDASVAQTLPADSVFDSLEAASGFFEKGSLGYAPSQRAGELHALELRSLGWSVQPMKVERVESSFFGDAAVFPVGSVEFDCALLMRTINHEWHAKPGMAIHNAA
jgi:hypothetical protein